MARAVWAALGLLLLAAAAEARFSPSEPAFGRALLQTDLFTGAECTSKTDSHCTGCRYIRINGATSATCVTCGDTYRLKADKSGCECQPGYKPSGGSCVACGTGNYCAGGSDAGTTCGTGLTTLINTASRVDQCVTIAGFGIAAGGTTAAGCGTGTYSVGKTRSPCTPCGKGLTTDAYTGDGSTAGAVSPVACKAPAGYYVSRGTARPCPKGTYTDSLNSVLSCTSCGTGVTTATDRSTGVAACTGAKPGYYILTLQSGSNPAVADACPKGTYQPVDAATVSSCTNCTAPLTTVSDGAKSADACVAPPGYGYDRTAGTATECGNGNYKSGYNKRACVPCGDNAAFTTDTTTASSFKDCYVPVGYGTTRTGSASYAWTAARCPVGSYGAAVKTFGVRNVPCTPCPAGMSTVGSALGVDDGTTLWSSPDACVTLPGYGYDSNAQTATVCTPGTYNAGSNRNECTDCGDGYTTDPAYSATNASACVVAPGYGYNSATSLTEACAPGSWSAGGTSAAPTPACSMCPANAWTQKDAGLNTAASDCSICRAGYGDTGSGCLICAENSYNTGDKVDCATCANSGQAPQGSVAASDCQAPWTELQYAMDVIDFAVADGSYVATDSAANATACRTACDGDTDCMYYAFKFTATAQCYLIKQISGGTDFVAFQNSDAFYTVWPFTASKTLGTDITVSGTLETARSGAGSAGTTPADKVHACSKVCDQVAECVAVVFDTDAGTADASRCKLKAAEMKDDYSDATDRGCAYKAIGAQMNMLVGDAAPWSAPTYTAGVQP